MFQFHKGTIKTNTLNIAMEGMRKFQFHKGTIKTGGKAIFLTFTYKFQFHKGTIKTLINSLLPPRFAFVSIP